MNLPSLRLLSAIALFSSPVLTYADSTTPAPEAPRTFARFVPERSDDFAWENDLIAFRVYGPALRKGNENSGIDAWSKRVPYPIVDKWYRLAKEEKISYHKDHGEGADFYHVGSSRGCGGTAIRHDGVIHLSNVYRDWKILSSQPEKTSFVLNYEYKIGDRTIQEEKTITIETGKRLFKSESRFSEGGKPVNDVEVVVGLTTQNQRGVVTMNRDAGWMMVWQDFRNNGKMGTGVVMAPDRITSMEEIRSETKDESHVILTTRPDADGRTVHYAGYGWDKAEAITTPEQWAQYLSAFNPSK